MTISSQIFRFTYVSTGGTTYQYTNKILADSDLVVYVSEVLKVLGTDYTVTGVGESSGGNVVFGTAPAVGATVLIAKDGVEFTQDTDYVENDAFPAAAHEDALDKLTNITQKIWDYVRRSIKLPITSALTDLEIPSPEANKVLGWNSTADNFQNLTLAGTGAISDEAYSSATWAGVDTIAPSKNAIRNKIESFFATAAEITTGTEPAKAIAPDQLKIAGIVPKNISNLYLKVNAAVNKLDIFARSNTAAPNATNVIRVDIPDANGIVTRAAPSEASQIIMADAANYWSKGSLDAEIKTAWLYAAWSAADSKIIWMLRGYSGFNMVSTSTTATDDDFCLLPDGNTYSRAATDFCVAVAKVRYQYDTADTPDHTIQATGENAPQVIWNPKSDYGYQTFLATTVTANPSIAEYSCISVMVKQSGEYRIDGDAYVICYSRPNPLTIAIKTGSSTYSSAIYVKHRLDDSGDTSTNNMHIAKNIFAERYLNAGDTIHLGVGLTILSGAVQIYGNETAGDGTSLFFKRTD